MKWLSILLSTCLSLLLVACSKNEDSEVKVQKEFTVKGIVLEVQDEGRTLVIDHEEMPGYMMAMTMPFRVKNPKEVAGISRGDEIQFTYKVAELSSWIENITKTGNKKELPQGPAKSEHSSNLLKVGDPFPDFELLDEQGQQVRLEDYRGSAIALSFIFTRCPVPEYCPTMMRNFNEVDEILKEDPEAPKNYKLLTVSFDPEHDTPEVMKAYGSQYGQKSANWNLLTSTSQESVRTLGQAVGLMFSTSKNYVYSHNLRTVVLDGAGKISKIFTDETWKPKALVEELKAAAADCCAVEESDACCVEPVDSCCNE